MWKPFNEFLDPSALPSIMDSQSEKQWIRHHAGDFLSKNKTHCQSFFSPYIYMAFLEIKTERDLKTREYNVYSLMLYVKTASVWSKIES